VEGRAFYADTIEGFLRSDSNAVLGRLTEKSPFSVDPSQRDAWLEQIRILRSALSQLGEHGKVYFEFVIPRMGKRIDVIAIVRHVIFVIEFKIGETSHNTSARDQVWDYALDLKNFHETSHRMAVAPVLVATRAVSRAATVATSLHNDHLLLPVDTNREDLASTLKHVLAYGNGTSVDPQEWEKGRYSPTPTIIEAAMALYGGHDVREISRSDAAAVNLSRTSVAVSSMIESSRAARRKSICFITGVPGAGKTLVGLNIATEHVDSASESYSVYLSGNGPLVAILREALARDKVTREKEQRRRVRLSATRSEVKAFIQNVHHFRDDCLVDNERPPVEHVVLFDEAQRAWDLERTSAFMLRKKQRANFKMSEPEFLISCLDRHKDWAVVVCLVGGGQEINTGEAGIGEWIRSVERSFKHWHVHVSPQLTDSEFGAGDAKRILQGLPNVNWNEDLHLGVSIRSFRAENVSSFIKRLLDCDARGAKESLAEMAPRYPVALTRDVVKAKMWLRQHARGTERYGLVVSSQAQRLKPHAIDVRTPMDPVNWFLKPKEDVRSSYYLEDAATEFHVQGLELDWSCVVWDADFRKTQSGWQHFSFTGDRWNRINKSERQTYLKNAYRVLLTRARQGMVIVVPEGDSTDATRAPEFYASTYEYLCELGLHII